MTATLQERDIEEHTQDLDDRFVVVGEILSGLSPVNDMKAENQEVTPVSTLNLVFTPDKNSKPAFSTSTYTLRGISAPGATKTAFGAGATTGLYTYPIFDPTVLYKIAKQAGIKLKDLWDFIIHQHIPQDWSNQKLLVVLWLLSQGRSCDIWTSYAHLENNKLEIPKVYNPGDFIENQGAWGDVLYGTPVIFLDGSGNMAYQGCEIIAVVNAYTAMGIYLTEDQVAELICHFEGRGGTLYGGFGTSPTVILEYLTAQGYETQVCQEENYTEIEQIAKTSDTLIVTVYNNEDDLTRMIHTVNVQKVDNGDGTYSYIVHNGHSTTAYPTAEQAIESIGDSGKTGVIQVIGVSKPTT